MVPSDANENISTFPADVVIVGAEPPYGHLTLPDGDAHVAVPVGVPFCVKYTKNDLPDAGVGSVKAVAPVESVAVMDVPFAIFNVCVVPRTPRTIVVS